MFHKLTRSAFVLFLFCESAFGSAQFPAAKADCAAAYAANHCEEFKNSLPQADQGKVIQCANEGSRAGIIFRSTQACLKAPFTFAWDLASFPYSFGKALYEGAKSLPMSLHAIAEGFEREAACYNDPEMKMQLMAPVLHSLYVDPDAENPRLNGEGQAMLGWTCVQIRERVQEKIDAYRKLLFCLEQPPASFLPGASPCNSSPTERQIEDAREYDRMRTVDQTVFDQLAYVYREKFHCFTAEAQTEEYCRMAVDVAASIPAIWSGPIRMGALALGRAAESSIQAARGYSLLTRLAESGGSLDAVRRSRSALEGYAGMDAAGFEQELAAARNQLLALERDYAEVLSGQNAEETAKSYGLIAKALDQGYEPGEIKAALQDGSFCGR